MRGDGLDQAGRRERGPSKGAPPTFTPGVAISKQRVKWTCEGQ